MPIPDYSETLMTAKQAKGLTFEQIGKALGHDKTWVATMMLGQASASIEEAQKLCEILGLDKSLAPKLTLYREKGALPTTIPTDPLIYRLYELIIVHGPAMKAVINEQFGDGIMSAIDFTMDIKRVEDPKGDRVVMTLNGKFLPYKKW
jgi:cyanate lyase